jgi:hypothetical protein
MFGSHFPMERAVPCDAMRSHAKAKCIHQESRSHQTPHFRVVMEIPNRWGSMSHGATASVWLAACQAARHSIGMQVSEQRTWAWLVLWPTGQSRRAIMHLG